MAYVKKGYLSDPPGMEMYIEMPKPPGSTSRLTKWRCLRSTSAEEGYHYHLARCVPENARGRATERTMTLKTNYFDFRWNIDAAKRFGDVPWAVRHYDLSLIDMVTRAAAKLGFVGDDAPFPGWRTVRWMPQKLFHGHHYFYESLKQQRAATLNRAMALDDVEAGHAVTSAAAATAVPFADSDAAASTAADDPRTVPDHFAATLARSDASSIEAAMSESEWRAAQMGIDGKLSRHLPAKTVKILLDNHVLTGNAQPEAIAELALQHGTLILPSAAANLAQTMARQQVADEEFQQGGRAFDVRQQLRDHTAPDLIPQSVEPLPPAVPETVANSLVAMPLVASTTGPASKSSTTIPLNPAAPGDPVAATTMLDNREAKKAATRERKRLQKQRQRGGLKRKPVVDSELNAHQKALKSARNKRAYETRKANQCGGSSGGGGRQ